MQSYKLVLAMSNLFEHWLKFQSTKFQSEIVTIKRAGRQHNADDPQQLIFKKIYLAFQEQLTNSNVAGAVTL